MKPAYNNLRPYTGAHVAGIVQIQVAPREWLTADPAIDFNTGKVPAAIVLQPGKQWVVLDLIADSYDYQEKPKVGKGGAFYDVSIGGTLNGLDAVMQQVLETLRHHELVVVLKDKQKRQKLVGNRTAGCLLQVAYREQSKNGGESVASIDLGIEVEERPPFYL